MFHCVTLRKGMENGILGLVLSFFLPNHLPAVIARLLKKQCPLVKQKPFINLLFFGTKFDFPFFCPIFFLILFYMVQMALDKLWRQIFCYPVTYSQKSGIKTGDTVGHWKMKLNDARNKAERATNNKQVQICILFLEEYYQGSWPTHP